MLNAIHYQLQQILPSYNLIKIFSQCSNLRSVALGGENAYNIEVFKDSWHAKCPNSASLYLR